VARHIFQACPVWVYTQSNITQAMHEKFLKCTTYLSHIVLLLFQKYNLLTDT
jgi:hypothetical protein